MDAIEERASESGIGDFETFFRDNYPRVVKTVFGLTGDFELARDAAQDGFVGLALRWHSLTSPDHAQRLVYRASINAGRSYWRKLRRTVLTQSPVDREEPDVADIVAARDAVRRSAKRLSRRQMEVVSLVQLGDLSPKEAADIMGTSESTVSVHLARARAVLRGELSGGG